jgi:hypothetical protein
MEHKIETNHHKSPIAIIQYLIGSKGILIVGRKQKSQNEYDLHGTLLKLSPQALVNLTCLDFFKSYGMLAQKNHATCSNNSCFTDAYKNFDDSGCSLNSKTLIIIPHLEQIIIQNKEHAQLEQMPSKEISFTAFVESAKAKLLAHTEKNCMGNCIEKIPARATGKVILKEK